MNIFLIFPGGHFFQLLSEKKYVFLLKQQKSYFVLPLHVAVYFDPSFLQIFHMSFISL